MSFTVNNSILAKGWKLFTLMHKDRRVASIREDGSCKIYSKKFLPYNIYLEEEDDIDTRVNNLNNFYYWCSSRVLTVDRKYAKEILNSIGARQAVTDRDRAMISISYHCLSLTDVYWVKRNKENIEFSDISLYSKPLSNVFVNVSLCGKQLPLQDAELLSESDVAGNTSVQGVSPKAWIRENDEIYLLKDGDERDVEAELLASKIASCFEIECVHYNSAVFDGRKVSKSRIITSEELSIVPKMYVEIYCTNHEYDIEGFILGKDSYSYHMMNLIDYLVGNTDRHPENWGFTVDNSTNKLGKLYPLMDFNKSFQVYDTVDGAGCLTGYKKQSQLEAALEAVKAVGLNQINEVNPDWFENASWRDMFFRRLELVKGKTN